MIDRAIAFAASHALEWIREQKEKPMLPKCQFCKREFKSEKGLSIHLGKSHKEELENPPPEIPPEPEVPMRVCGLPVVEPEEEESGTVTYPIMEGLPPISPAPTVVPKKVTEIPEGAIIELKGTLYWRHPGTGEWSPEVAEGLPPAKVVQRIVTSDGSVSLMCIAQGGNAVWAVPEEGVLSGKLRILNLPGGLFVPPEPQISKSPTDQFRAKEAERIRKRAEDLKRYEPSIKRFGEAKKSREAAKKLFDQVKNSEKPVIERFVREYGTESSPDKGDFVVKDCGYKAHLIRTPGQPAIKRDTQRIEEYLTNHASEWAHNCLKYTLVVEKWEEAKKAGLVPPEFIREVETVVQNDDTFALRVDPL